eukprot:796312-Amphidinium_carterae.1
MDHMEFYDYFERHRAATVEAIQYHDQQFPRYDVEQNVTRIVGSDLYIRYSIVVGGAIVISCSCCMFAGLDRLRRTPRHTHTQNQLKDQLNFRFSKDHVMSSSAALVLGLDACFGTTLS